MKYAKDIVFLVVCYFFIAVLLIIFAGVIKTFEYILYSFHHDNGVYIYNILLYFIDYFEYYFNSKVIEKIGFSIIIGVVINYLGAIWLEWVKKQKG